jgi:hypothetical protein
MGNIKGQPAFRGVSWHAHRCKWRIKIKAHGRHYNLGYSIRPDEAARIWDAAAFLLRGAAARLNFSDTPSRPEYLQIARERLVRLGAIREKSADGS